MSKIHWMIQKLPSPSNRPCFAEISLTLDETLQSILKRLTIIEYPTIEVVPEDQLKDFPLAIQEFVSANKRVITSHTQENLPTRL